jgi:hypothetical protein
MRDDVEGSFADVKVGLSFETNFRNVALVIWFLFLLE